MQPPSLSGQLFLVTGGAGFIGSHLVERLLAAGHAVRVLDDLSTGRTSNLPAACELVVGDVADAATVARAIAGASGVFHLAAIASVARGNEDWLGTHRVNQTGTVTVLDGARQAGRMPVVYASSAAIYGDAGENAIREDHCPQPMTAYGADKLGSELHATVAYHVHRVPTFGLRFFNVYGPRQDPLSPYSGVISIFARRIARGEAITINGDGGQTRDFVYVADVVDHLVAAMAYAARHGGAQVRNVCTGRVCTVAELARLLGEVGGKAPRINQGPARAGDIRHSRGNPEAARAMLGVSARTMLRTGLHALLESFGPVDA